MLKLDSVGEIKKMLLQTKQSKQYNSFKSQNDRNITAGLGHQIENGKQRDKAQERGEEKQENIKAVKV